MKRKWLKRNNTQEPKQDMALIAFMVASAPKGMLTIKKIGF